MKSLSHWIASKGMLVCPGKIWGAPSNNAGVPKTWNVSCWTLLDDCYAVRSQTWKQVLSTYLRSIFCRQNLEMLVVFWGVLPLLLLSSFFSTKILKWVFNKALNSQILLVFNCVYLSHECLLLSLVTLKLVGPVLLGHIRLSWSVSLCLLSLWFLFGELQLTPELDSRLPWRTWGWSGSKDFNAGINDVSVQLESGLTLLTCD